MSYRLVKPYQSTKIHTATTLMHGAGKCHRELKKSSALVDKFSIQDITNNKTYTFSIKNNTNNTHNTHNIQLNQVGGQINKLENKFDNTIKILDSKLETIHSSINLLNKKIDNMKMMNNDIINKHII